MAADRILLASVVSTGGARGRVDAVRVHDGRVAAVGGRADLLADRRGAEVVDLGSAAVLPGFVEPHTHPDLCAQLYSWVDVSGFTHPTVDGVEAALRDAVEATPPGEWVFAFGLDPMLTADLGAWGRDRLDAITAGNPVFVMIQSMHTAFVNSMALERAGLTDTTPDPGGGGSYGRDADGRLDGRLEEQEAMLPFLLFMDFDPSAMRGRLADQYRRYAEVGITQIGVAGTFTGVDEFPIFVAVADDPATPVRTVAYLRHHLAATLPGLPRHGDRYRVQGVKLWYDGSPYTGTMLVDEPYLDTDLCCCTLGIAPGTVGRPNFTFGEMRETLSALHGDGWQVLTHAQGDRGCREILDLYAQVLGPDGQADHRWRLEHCALISTEDLERSLRLGVSPSFHVNHVLHYGPELRDEILGPERAERLMPVAAAADMGHHISLHADSPMYPPGPLSLVRTAVTRRTRHGDVLGGRHAIGLDRALRAVTSEAAWQLGDDEGGAIEVGRRADFTVLERDLYDVAVDDLDKVAVIDTWLDGVSVGHG